MADINLSRGQKYTLVYVSLAKMALQTEMPPDMRLQFLQSIEKSVDIWLSADMIASIAPMDERSYEIMKEIMKLDRGKPAGKRKSLDICADKFEIFAALNPTLNVHQRAA
ncbi:hypothetical protein [Bradyrhizobium sp. HKCCYLS2033]|uniref:hypothetical protein n=1 Tax=Bradyrhizobium sp. HKCCYLS2033 TaxID=3420739 RepID=UPI003EB69DE5